jgi:hypothetical protein
MLPFSDPTVAEAHAAEIVSQIANAAYSKDLLNIIVDRISSLGFEAKKDCVQIFTKLLRREYGSRSPTAEHICGKPEILTKLVNGYDEKYTQVDALNSGLMLRECIKKDTLAKIILYDEVRDFLVNVCQAAIGCVCSNSCRGMFRQAPILPPVASLYLCS